ncbi:MAG: hypothetical protein P8Z00_15400 [Anaerolineales bacterium]
MRSTKFIISLLCLLLVAGATLPGTKTIFLPMVSSSAPNRSLMAANTSQPALITPTSPVLCFPATPMSDGETWYCVNGTAIPGLPPTATPYIPQTTPAPTPTPQPYPIPGR